MANKDDLSKRILRTKKESEELQAQLQKLIELGKSQSQNYVNAKLVEQENENELNTNKVQIIKSYDPNYSKHIDKPIPSKSVDKSKASCSSSKINPNVEPSKKTKCYDVNEAREYIKKQKEKRLKQHQTVNTAAPDIRKKKLEELRKKSRELVARNVELTRARSKSRERKDCVRLDEFNKKGITGYVTNNAVEFNNLKKINVLSNIVLKSPDDSKQFTSRIPQPSKSVTNLAEQDEHKTLEENSEQINVSSNILQPQIDYKCEVIQNPSDKYNIESQDEYQIHKKINCEENFCDKDINIGNFKKEFPEWLKESPAQAYPFNFINTVKRKLQFVINSPKPTVDIGVQSTCPKNMDLLEHCVSSYHSRKNEVVDANRISNLKSFESHNYDNLDGKSIEHLELIPKKDTLYSDKVPSLVPTEFNENHIVSKIDTESESDTSKNIPEISSESGSSLHKNAASVRRNLNLDFEFINTEKIKDLKLKQPVKSTSTTIGSDIKYSPNKNGHKINKQSKILDNKYLKPPDYTILTSLNDQYVSDFESPTNLKESINRSRESILSFNSPEFSKQIIKSPPPDKFSLKNNLSVKSKINNIPPTGVIQNLNCLNNSQNGSISSNSEVPPSSMISTNFDISRHVKSNTSISISSVLPKSKGDKITEIILPREFTFTNNKENIVEEGVVKAGKLNSKSNNFSRSTLHNGNVNINSTPSKTNSNSVSTNFEDSKVSTAQSNSYIESGASVVSKSIKSQITTQRSYVNTTVNEKPFDIPPLQDPDIYLIKNTNKDYEHKDALIKNVSIKSKAIEDNKDSVNVNEIHLKFEAEIHLLNDFNESLRKFSAAEKVFETLKNKNELVASNILQNRDTQTSIPKDSLVSNVITENNPKQKKSRSGISFINFSRGSFIDESLSNDTLDNSVLTPLGDSKTMESTNVRLSELSTGKIESIVENKSKLMNFKNLQNNNFDGFTLNMFDLLIKDEDARLENLKTNLKIREKILLDRTRAELAWLEIQKKHYKETGNLQEASTVKKKQRAILLNHEKEKHEMQKLKQMRKAASAERKTILKQQRNLIRKQLSTENMLENMKVSTPRERRLSGPLKVIQSHTESILSETSVSRKSSSDRDKEVYSILSHHSVSKVSEISEVGISLPKESQRNLLGVGSTKRQEHIKKALLMRETVLKKRKEAAEELLQWHKQLSEEEQRIEELELKAASVISQRHSINSSDDIDKHKFMGKQLNQLWYNLTGSKEKKFTAEKIYPMSQNALEQFCKSAREYSLKAKKVLKGNSSDYSDSSVSENIPRLKQSEEKESHKQKTISTNEYASDFEIESITNEKNVSVIENISELICNFGKIEDDILSLNFMHSKKSDEEKATTFRTDSELGVSVIETNKDFKESDQSLPFKTNTSTKSSHIQNKIEDFSIITENVIEDEIPPKDISAKNEQNISDLMKFEGSDQSINTDQSKVVNDEIQENLNDSKEILKLLGEPEDNIDIEIKLPSESDKSKENINTSEDILLTLTQNDSNVDSIKSLLIPGSDELKKSFAATTPVEEIITKDRNDVNDTESNKVEVVTEEKLEVSPTSISENTQESTNIKLELESGIEDLVVASEAQEDHQDESSVVSNKTQEKIIELCLSDIVQPEHEEFSENVISVQNIPQTENIPSDITTENGEDIISAKISSKVEVSTLSEKENNQINISKKISPGSNGVSLHISNNIKQVTSIYLNSDINIDEVDEAVDTECNESLSEDSQEHSGEKINQKTDITPISEENKETSNDISSLHEVTDPLSVSAEKIKSKAAGVEDFPNGDLKYVESKNEYKSDIESNSVSNKIIENSEDKDHIKTVVNGTALECEIQSSIKEQSNSNINSIHNDQESQSLQDEVSMPQTEFKENNVDYVNSFESPSISSDSQISALVNDKASHSEKSNATESSKHTSSGDKSLKQGTIDIKKRVLEILADANQGSRGDKSPRLQDLYVTTYDLVSPPNSPDSGYPVNNRKLATPSSIFGNEAEEILKKQLAIEQEIKQITEQQQREQQIPFLYVREIPNKPPPPYTPPSLQLPVVNIATVIPSVEEVEKITKYSAKILYKAYLSNNLDNISISENTLSLISKSIPKERYKFVFDVCKDLAKQYYKQFEEEKVPSWLQLPKKPHLSTVKPLDVNGLERHIAAKLKEILGYEKSKKRENAIIKWSRKKRDHVDEILVTECQTEELQWTNYEKDELLVMDQLTNEIMNELIKETAERFSNIFSKRN